MLVIPVLDIQNGIVVHAKQGERERYQAVSSVLTNKTDIESVLSAYFKLYPFKIIYIADLDAIQQQGDNLEIIKKLGNQYPDCEFWLDAGFSLSQKILTSPTHHNIKVVLGSENRMSEDDYIDMVNTFPELILSLDFNADGFIENDYLLQKSELWPKKVIIMMLNKVGMNTGIDTDVLNQVIKSNKHSELYAAGGICNITDIEQLDSHGIEGCLLASALHNGEITEKDIKRFS